VRTEATEARLRTPRFCPIHSTCLVGERPSERSDPGDPMSVSFRSFQNLSRLLRYPEVPDADVLLLFTPRANVIDEPPSVPWNRVRAIKRARHLVRRYDSLILLGRRVVDAFEIDAGGETCFTIERAVGGRRVQLHAMPHPSGRSRWWNEPDNRERAAKFLRRVINARPPTDVELEAT
jgi:uracil-DNA glycosylase